MILYLDVIWFLNLCIDFFAYRLNSYSIKAANIKVSLRFGSFICFPHRVFHVYTGCFLVLPALDEATLFRNYRANCFWLSESFVFFFKECSCFTLLHL